MALLLLASAWYIALVAVAATAAWNAHLRRTAERAEAEAILTTYEERRDRGRAQHLARVREEELAEMRRRERRLHNGAHA